MSQLLHLPFFLTILRELSYSKDERVLANGVCVEVTLPKVGLKGKLKEHLSGPGKETPKSQTNPALGLQDQFVTRATARSF